ncbi:MAG: alpha/beta hydrolase [Bryobacteraceae bacterium]
MPKHLLYYLAFSSMAMLAAEARPEVVLWPNLNADAPAESTRLAPPRNERVVSGVHRPSITPYLPANATGTAVIIAPGGGHRELWTDHEGHNVAKYLSDHGVAAFVLKYRLAREKDSKYTIEGDALSDILKALEVVRARAAEWKVDPARVGVMGFSAGGELAALAAVSTAKPAFQALIYPAIPRNMTLTKDTPPAFLVCGENDRQSISQGLPELYLALKKAGAPAEIHVYSGVGHGFGLRDDMKGPVKEWLIRFHEWLGARGLLAVKP